MENLIDNYDQKFASYKYFEATDSANVDFSQLYGSKNLFLEDSSIHQNVASNNSNKAKQQDQALLNPHKDYQSKTK